MNRRLSGLHWHPRPNHYARVLDELRPIGDFQTDNVRRQHIIKLRNKMTTNDRTRDLFVAATSRAFTIGMDLGCFLPWPKAQREKFEASEMPQWLRTAYMLGLYTGQREGDVLRLARAWYDGAWFHVRQARPEANRGKGRKGRLVELEIPAVKMLRDYLAGLTLPGLLFVTHEDGSPIKAQELQHELRKRLDALGMQDCSFHGLCHTTCTALAEAGASDRQIMAITGHLTEQMVSRYTKKANQKLLAADAMRSLRKGTGCSD